MTSPFVYWKLPNQAEVYTLQNIKINTVAFPNFNEEGFLFFPFEKSREAYFLSGKIKEVAQFSEDLTFYKNKKNANKKNFSINYNLDSEIYKKLIKSAISEMDKGTFKKVVLARKCTQSLPQFFDLKILFDQLCNAYQRAFVYVIKIENEVWIGATPELLLKKEAHFFLTNALAGTKSENAFGEKEKQEQLLVKNYILDLLNKSDCKSIQVSELKELNTGNLVHLINEVQFETDNPEKVLSLLHPTPAVCGTPLIEAQKFIQENENLERNYYSGYLGPIQSDKNFSLWVNLRCANISENEISYYSGAGIIAESDADKELLETERKMDTLRKFVNSL